MDTPLPLRDEPEALSSRAVLGWLHDALDLHLPSIDISKGVRS